MNANLTASRMIRSKLFVPGSRPELFDKAFASSADAVSFDLEDAVPPERKAEARVAAGEAKGRGVGAFLLDGKMADAPVIAQAIVYLATRIEKGVLRYV
jgi:citrate lyase beta subunit